MHNEREQKKLFRKHIIKLECGRRTSGRPNFDITNCSTVFVKYNKRKGFYSRVEM